VPWPPTSRRLACRLALLALVLFVGVAGVRAQALESVLSPGRLIQDHAKWDDECKACHVRFDRAAQDGLCMDCHKDIGQDLRGRTGLHGRLKPQACRSCHTEHKGRDAQIAPFDRRQFDHAQTDFALRAAHAKVDCAKCHEPARKYREAASDCNGCHRKDDVHKGSLGAKCADCHTEANWREAKFDHETTRFPLAGKHVDAKCGDCHKDKSFKDTPRQCVGCHRKDDDGAEGHKGLYGEKCESCHNAKAWKPSTFNHDTLTKYLLRGKHRAIQCADCHTGHLYKVKLATDCWSCHRKDDKHKESLGRDCGSCHTEKDWKERARFDHDKTKFALLGKHADAKCDACHKSKVFNEAPKQCIGCHRKDDRHEATLGEDCAGCHVERDWKTTKGRFDHDRTKFRLRNAHAAAKVQCSACHETLKSFRKTPLDCFGCHRKDDKHGGQSGPRCESCHDDKSWKVPRFDHNRARFALLGRHLTVACKDCHATPRFKDAASDCWSCHKKDDKHKFAFGAKCESCHNARAWTLWDFDHNRRSTYKVTGAHVKVACEACHTRPAPADTSFAPLPSNCLACHRKDDRHDGAFGTRCEQCHVTEDWKKVSNRVLRTSRAPGDDAVAAATPAAALGEASHFARIGQRRGPNGWLQ
jgi:hypothetical protein